MLLLAAVALATVRPCIAGAFMLEPGTGQFIAGVGYSAGSRRFDQWGQAVPAPSFSKLEASGFFEYGVTDAFDLVLAPTLAHEHDGPATNTVTGSDASAFGGRVALYTAPGGVVALQVLVQPPTADESLDEELADGGARAFATDVRLMLGKSFMLFGWPAFVDVDPGVRFRAAPFANEARIDATLGVRPWPRLLLLAQDFSSFAPPSGPLIERVDGSKLQVSAVYDVSKVWSLQVGGFRTFAGRNIVRETGPLAALWYRF